MKNDTVWMQAALEEAERAFAEGEVPVGAVVVCNDAIIARAHNQVEKKGIPFEHAEAVAMWRAIDQHDRFVLEKSTVYVTIEPCTMCVGAMLLARVPRVVFGAREPKTGACESVLAIPNTPELDHQITVVGGVEADRARELMQRFFRQHRKQSDPAQ